jgi:hypothetical protein
MNNLCLHGSWHRFRAALLLALAACGATSLAHGPLWSSSPAEAAVQGAGIPRDWKKHPAIVEFPAAAELYALGDVHGDYNRLVKLLAAGEIIREAPARPKDVRWAAGESTLVCTGDLIDKGNHALKVIKLFRALQTDAEKAGGRVVITMGNHEAAFLANPDNHKVKVFVEELRRHELDPDIVAAGRDKEGVGQFLRSLPLAACVGDWFFAHAGYTRGRTLKQLRTELEEGIDARGYDTNLSVPLDALLEARLHPLPWWEVEGDRPEDSRGRLAGYVKALGVGHLIVGHQPGRVKFSAEPHRPKGKMWQQFDGLIFLIDVGMSEAIDYSDGALLHVHSGRTATAIHPNGRREVLWQTKGP